MSSTQTVGAHRAAAEAVTTSVRARYPFTAIAVLGLVHSAAALGLGVLAPDLSVAIGLGRGSYGAMAQLALILSGVGVLLGLKVVVADRVSAAVGVAVVAANAVILTGFAAHVLGVLLSALVLGIAAGVASAVLPALAFDTADPSERVRSLGTHRAGILLGAPVAAALLALGRSLELTVRGQHLLLGSSLLLAALVAVRLREPPARGSDTSGLGVVEILRRLLGLHSVRELVTAGLLLGALGAPTLSYLAIHMEQRWRIDDVEWGWWLAAPSTIAAIGLVLLARIGDRALQAGPNEMARLGMRALLAALGFLTVAALAPAPIVLAIALVGFLGCTAAATVAAIATLLAVAPPQWRTHASALFTAATITVGGLVGHSLLGSLDRRFGTRTALLTLAVLGLVGVRHLRAVAQTANADLDRVVTQLAEEEEVERARGRGDELALLSCRDIDFAYGDVQVLFDVDFTIEEGEMVALLGTNGAGKSTLLRVISGLGIPSRGAVRYRGRDITFVDAERRVGMGITQIPGGRAAFQSLSVVENLRLSAYQLGRDTARVERGIDRSFEVFPRLAERRNSLATTLSGGERQMLALSRALILEPQLLLIDELSLGLAPKIVGKLLEMVRQVNATGTAVVLVEQSANVALSLVKHAYFMEKGAIRFDGPADELLHRGDLLRSVFFGETARATAD